jgi:hypothetical protein
MQEESDFATENTQIERLRSPGVSTVLYKWKL